MAWLLRGALDGRGAGAAALLSATTLPLVVVLTQVAVDAGVMPAAEAVPMVGAGMLSVIEFPGLDFRLAGVARRPPSASEVREGL